MKTSKDDTEAEGRKLLGPLVRRLVYATLEQRRQAVVNMLPHSGPQALRLLTEILIKRLDSKKPKVCDGAAATLTLLGPHILPTIHWAVITKPTERRLLYLAPVAAAIGRNLSETERTKLQMVLFVAGGLAPTLESCAAVGAAIRSLRELLCEEHEAEMTGARKRQTEEGAELLARYSTPRCKTGRQVGQSTSPAARSSSTKPAS